MADNVIKLNVFSEEEIKQMEAIISEGEKNHGVIDYERLFQVGNENSQLNREEFISKFRLHTAEEQKNKLSNEAKVELRKIKNEKNAIFTEAKELGEKVNKAANIDEKKKRTKKDKKDRDELVKEVKEKLGVKGKERGSKLNFLKKNNKVYENLITQIKEKYKFEYDELDNKATSIKEQQESINEDFKNIKSIRDENPQKYKKINEVLREGFQFLVDPELEPLHKKYMENPFRKAIDTMHKQVTLLEEKQSPTLNDYFEVLGVDSNITQPQLKKVLRNLMKEYHPDNINNDPEYVAKSGEILSNLTKINKELIQRYDLDKIREIGLENIRGAGKLVDTIDLITRQEESKALNYEVELANRGLKDLVGISPQETSALLLETLESLKGNFAENSVDMKKINQAMKRINENERRREEEVAPKHKVENKSIQSHQESKEHMTPKDETSSRKPSRIQSLVVGTKKLLSNIKKRIKYAIDSFTMSSKSESVEKDIREKTQEGTKPKVNRHRPERFKTQEGVEQDNNEKLENAHAQMKPEDLKQLKDALQTTQGHNAILKAKGQTSSKGRS